MINQYSFFPFAVFCHFFFNIYSFNPRLCISQKVETGIPVLSKGMLASGTCHVCTRVCVYVCVHSDTQSFLTLCDPMDCTLPGLPSMGFSRKEYWSGLPFPSPGDLHDPGIEPRSPVLQADSLQSEPSGKTLLQAAQVALVVKKPLPMQET